MFDPSAPHIIILLVVVLLLFGSSRLPGAAKSLGRSMHIFKSSVKGMDEEDKKPDDSTVTQATVLPPTTQTSQQWQPAPQQLTPPRSDPAHQAQLDDLQRQIQELQRASAGGNGSGAPVSDAPPTSQSS